MADQAPNEQPNDEPRHTTDSLGRKVWDKQYFAEKAAEKAALDPEGADLALFEDAKRKRKTAPPPKDRQNLQQRGYNLNLDAELGRMRVVTAHTPKQLQGGFWCDVCECLIKDSQAFLDHVNGKRHNRMLGMTMKVERVTAEKVRDKLKRVRQTMEESQAASSIQEADVEARLEEAREDERARKLRKKERRQQQRKENSRSAAGWGEEGDDDEESMQEAAERRKMLEQMGLPSGFV